MELYKGLNLDEYVVFDIETTGTDYLFDRIIEIAAVRYKDGKEIETFNHLINPHCILNESISNLTGINNKDLEIAQDIDVILPEFMDFVKGDPLVAHNIDFDIKFINHQIKLLGLDELSENELHDTLLLSQIIFPTGPSNHKLSVLAEYLDISSDRFHRALDDCKVTGSLFEKIITKSNSLSESTVKKIVTVAGRSKYVSNFFVNLANFYVKNAFSRKINENRDQKLSRSNVLEMTTEPDIEQLIQLDNTDISSIVFKENGLLHKIIPNYEYREEQYLLAKKCDDVLKDGKILISEAGTGVGKSYAYLVPSILYSLINQTKIVISTNTKNLQEQIFFKDLPVMHEMFRESFKAVLLKGRSNYLCRNRFENIIRRPLDNLTENEINQFLPLVYWAEITNTGDIEENSGFKMGFARNVWSKTVSDKGYCSGKKCRFYKSCYLQNARNNSYKSNIVIINHSLLFSDLASDNAILGKFDQLVIDEAHNVENSATKYLGMEYNTYQLNNLVYRIYSSRQRNNLCSRIENNSSLFKTEKNNLSDLAEKLSDKISIFQEKGINIFQSSAESIYNKYGTENVYKNIIKNRYKNVSELMFENDSVNMFKQLNEDVIGLIRRISVALKLESEKNSELEEIYLESESVLDQAELLYESFLFFDQSQRENYVFWYELTQRNEKMNLALYSAPLDVSEILNNNLYAEKSSIILTSATMTIENRFKYMKKKLGLDLLNSERIEEISLGSPFDLKNQLNIIVPSYFSGPKNSKLFDSDITQFFEYLIEYHNNGTLALFTSYRQMREIASRTKEAFLRNDRLLIVQGSDGNRTDIIKQFKKVTDSFLFGTDSFWEGIDVPGESLHTLIIVKLPFAVPTEPIIQARIEEIVKKGNDAFMFYSVPEAILKFKQGVGRLIRHKTDQGKVYVLDSRVINTRWGRAFINSLPVKVNVASTFSDIKEI